VFENPRSILSVLEAPLFFFGTLLGAEEAF
jgi:hypothetical protein